MSDPTGNGRHVPPDAGQRRKQQIRELRRRRIRRGSRRAYVRSVQFLPSMATLGNALCGFGAIYVATLDRNAFGSFFLLAPEHVDFRYMAAVYLIALAMIFDALDGRLARFARHTTDFGGQLDSLADVLSFGAAPAFIALHVVKFDGVSLPPWVNRLVFGVAGLYVACALIRLARFNVSNDHGEENHQSFLGLPSPGAAGALLALVLVQQDLHYEAAQAEPGTGWHDALVVLGNVATALIPIVMLCAGLLMVSGVRYPHMVNRYVRGKKGIGKLVVAVVVVMALVVAHRYALGLIGLWFLLTGPVAHLKARRITTEARRHGEASLG